MVHLLLCLATENPDQSAGTDSKTMAVSQHKDCDAKAAAPGEHVQSEAGRDSLLPALVSDPGKSGGPGTPGYV